MYSYFQKKYVYTTMKEHDSTIYQEYIDLLKLYENI